ncbi:hypothetical protein ACFOWU_08340 [Epilithonimonas zeae]|uniref:Lipoprotein n=1 Tax=Epilithonimonas zeae TaxID=1416779 RepID=A0A1N6GAK2_9FLAO|nr:hypothetical protein [Epilithonimonas zeae]SIO04579.1 hypothetical protein SAMN05444409_1742 [Epilithonimonas zeae]
MKKILFILISIVSLLTACETKESDKDLQRIVFDAGDLKFISTSMNTIKGTSSALYGNQEALTSLQEEKSLPLNGSILKLVTWKYHDNPQYIGGTITGELLSIETLETDKNGNINYQLKDDSKTKHNSLNRDNRIKYIMSYKPVTRP